MSTCMHMCFHVCVCVVACVYASVCMCAHVGVLDRGQPLVFSGTICLVFCSSVSHWPAVH